MRSMHAASSEQATPGKARCADMWMKSASILCVLKPLRSEEHTSELQSQSNLVCRLLLEKKKAPVPSPLSQFHLAPVLSIAHPTPAASPLSLHDALPICVLKWPSGELPDAVNARRIIGASHAGEGQMRGHVDEIRFNTLRTETAQIGRAHV